MSTEHFTSYSPTWDECYAVQTKDWTSKETDPNDPNSDPEENVWTDLKRGESKVSAPSSRLRPPRRTLDSSTLTSSSPPSYRLVKCIPRSGRRWRSPRPAVRDNNSGAGGSMRRYYRESKPGGSSRSGRFMSRYKRRRCSRERRCTTSSVQHLPAAIPPSHWYQAIGRSLCVDCKARGWVQNTSWMCVSCNVALCLVPYRNCFSRWHIRRF